MAQERAKVLIADDDPAILRLLAKWLTLAGYDVACAADGPAALAEIESSCPNFLVTDWEMPGETSGLALCEHVRRSNLPHYVYTIMLTGRTDADDFVQALRSGADDFTRKPVDRVELLARLQAGARIVELEHRLSLLANQDPLTGLANKRTFEAHFERVWLRALRHDAKLSCIMLDIDYFKRINDTHGHPAGDQVLRNIGRVLAESCRPSDFVGRVGGEEFCVVLTDADEDQAVLWAERVRSLISATPVSFDNESIRLTISFGVAQRTADVTSPSQLADLADQCLIAAKQAGRDRVTSRADLERISAACRDAANPAGAIFAGVTARDVMTTIVAALSSDATLGSAARYFLRYRYTSAPVVDDRGALVGFLSEKDVMSVLLWPDCWTRRISDVMKTNVVCYEEDEPILSVYEFLCRLPMRSVVVVRDGRPTGIISRGTLLRWFGNVMLARGPAGQTVGDDHVSPSRQQLMLIVAAIFRQNESLRAAIERSEADEVTPQLVGAASRIQELINDLLAGGQQAVGRPEARLIGACGWGAPRVEALAGDWANFAPSVDVPATD